MGRFSTTVQIKTVSDNAGFIDAFCEWMKKRGFEKCPENEAAVTYLLAFGGSWAALVNEEYSENPRKAYEDSRKLSETIQSSAFTVEVVDSDFAVLTLQNGDTMIVGDGSGYGMERPVRGTRRYWEPLIAEGKTWRELSKICEKENIFVEDTLSELAEIFGIDPELIFADTYYLSEDENATALYFKKRGQKGRKVIPFPGNRIS